MTYMNTTHSIGGWFYSTVVILGCVWPTNAQTPGGKKEYERLVKQSLEQAQKKQFTEAETSIRAALKISPADEWAWRHLSFLQRHQHKFSDALESAQLALKRRKSCWAYLEIAEAAFGALDYPLARKSIADAKKLGEKACGDAWKLLDQVRERLAPREYVLTDRVDPKKCKLHDGKIRLWIAQSIPPYQTAKSKAVGARSFTVKSHGDLQYVEVEPNGDQPFEIVTTFVVTPAAFQKELKSFQPAESLPAEVKQFLGPSPQIDIGDEVKALAEKLKGKDDLETVGNICAWFRKHMKYDDNAGGDTAKILQSCRGHCDAICRLCTALGRAAGVAVRPVRMNWGYLEKEVVYHSLCEMWVRGVGWIPFDPFNESLSVWPNLRWPNVALRLHYYPAQDWDFAQWVELVRPDTKPPTYTTRLLAE
ncbi:MAG: hypothetical protein L0Y72_11685 [Gemmataceae bacterium]|nr:hypothetical protein [Gemmataceae bacterium]MCI0739697.1 hypothetical protein [Gemmataceae bacterium]